ncbi:MAG: S8 family serine peptidase [Kiritimatiellia bacterium]|jgi:hypothetical protein|nr:S8 family serine peptidase [Kiritimatiellia bacterium]
MKKPQIVIFAILAIACLLSFCLRQTGLLEFVETRSELGKETALTDIGNAAVPAGHTAVDSESARNIAKEQKQQPAAVPLIGGESTPHVDRASRTRELRNWSQESLERAKLLSNKSDKPRRGTTEGRTFELIAIHGNRVYSYITCNNNAAISTAADKVRDDAPYYLDGQGILAGVWDGGLARTTHDEFGGRVTAAESASIHYHSTHVAGTIAASGVVANAKGMAPAVSLASYEWNNDVAEMTDAARSSPEETGVIQISNHSYGLQTGWESGPQWFGSWNTPWEADGFGMYDVYAATWDSVCYNAPYYLPFKAAGNDRNDNAPGAGASFEYYDNGQWVSKTYDPTNDPPKDGWDSGGFDTILPIGNAKNIMTVGAVNDGVTSGERDVSKATMTAFSGWGPADDGRVKPDIVANGYNLYSTDSGNDSDYRSLSGTSMATPNAAGSAILLTQLYGDLFTNSYMLASTLKSLIIHTADDIGRPGPDYSYGWGLMNTEAAAEHITAHHSRTNVNRIIESTVTGGTPYREHTFLWNNSSPIRVTLAWTDYPGSARGELDDRSPVLVHDLDLRVIDPLGNTNMPYVLSVTNPLADATSGDNTVDNIEQVDIATPGAPGLYRATIQFKGDLVTPSQAYSLHVSGAGAPPEIVHTPLGGSTNYMGPISLEATITCETALATNQLWVLWKTSLVENVFSSNQLSHSAGDVYSGQIPPHPIGTVVQYYIMASATNGLTSTDPDAAPSATHSFLISTPVNLTVSGSPMQIATADPPYGATVFPSGDTIRVTADLYSESLGGFRYENSGWQGQGSVPPSGTSNEVTFLITNASSITWQWTPTFSLVQTSWPLLLIDTTNWWPVATTGQTIEAPMEIPFFIEEYRFTGWYMDGQRLPDATNAASNPATGIFMDGPKTVDAFYMYAGTDDDGDELPDWWEQLYFGSTSVLYNVDSDDDGFTNMNEYEDGSNPRDPASIPEPPAIAHSPISGTRTTPAPWNVSATVTDNHMVASVSVQSSRNGEAWVSSDMSFDETSGTYTGAIPYPGVTGDSFEYEIHAEDGASLVSSSGPYPFDVQYPLALLTPTDLGTILLPSWSHTNTSLSVSNAGHRDLEWTLDMFGAGLADDIEGGTNDWTHSGDNDAWHVSGTRVYSGTQSWFFGDDDAGRYPDFADAALVSRPLLIIPGARLSFMHWLQTETPMNSSQAWDGCFVEISTNDGMDFVQLEPEGGYPYTIYGHSQSPYANGTPCFAGSTGWQLVEFDLSAYAYRIVRVAFRFGSDGLVTSEGWYIDDIYISGAATGAWLSVSSTNGTVVVSNNTEITATAHTTNVAPAQTVAAALRVQSNDPEVPVRLVPVFLHNITRTITVEQPEHGSIQPPGTVFLISGQSTNFLVTAEQYYHVEAFTTNGVTVAVPGQGIVITNFAWSNVTLNSTFGADVLADLVTNGVPEWWLAGHNLTNAPLDEEAMSDQDEDGMFAWEEYVAGTDPTNSYSVFEIVSIGTDGTNAILQWPSASNRMYHVYGRNSVTSVPVWIETNIPATPPTNILVTPAPLIDTRFYRVGVTY